MPKNDANDLFNIFVQHDLNKLLCSTDQHYVASKKAKQIIDNYGDYIDNFCFHIQ